MKKTLSLLAASVVALSAGAQTFSPTLDQGASLDQQVIGDTNASADRTQSTSNQIGNSANANGAQLGVTNDTRDQNTVNSSGGAATGGAAIGNQSDNKSSVGNTSSNSGGNVLGGATSGGNNLSNGGNTTGGNTLSNGSSSGGNTMVGGSNAAQGGAGGTASSNGTNLGINGQQQGIDRSGNSANTNANTAAQGQGQGQGQQQANNGTNAQGQTSANTNTNTAGGNTGGNSANRNSQATNTSAGNGAGAGAGSGNRTSNTTALAVDASDRSSTSYESRAVAWAPVIHGPAAAPLAAANLVVVPGKCGPRMMVVSKNIVGQRFKSILPDSTFDQTTSDRLVTLTDGNGLPLPPFENRGGFLMGHEVTILATTIGTSTAGSISLGIFGKSNDAAQGGSSSSGSVQQIVKEIELRECVFAMPKADALTPPADRTHAPAPKADRN